MSKRLLIVITICGVILSLTACGQTATVPPEETSGIIGDVLIPDTSDTPTTEPEPSAPETSETISTPPATGNNPESSTPTNNSAAGATSKPTNPPATSSKPPSDTQTPSKPSTGTSQPTTSTPAPSTSQPTTSTPAPSTPTPSTPSTPPTPDYEILGQDYINGVLAGVNERRAALGLSAAKLDSALSEKCLVQAKIMTGAGYAFHSENPGGCEAVAKMPYNFPAELLGDLMCDHVPNFLDADRTKVGIAVIKKGNSLFAVLQGTY